MRKGIVAWLLWLCLGCLLVCGACAEAVETPEALSYEGFTLMAQTDTRQLWLDEKTMQVRLVDIASGRAVHTKEMKGQQGNKTVKNTQKSDLFITYIANEKVGTTGVIDSYSLSVDLDNYEVSPLENGFSVRYTIGDTTLVIDDLPKMVPVEKYNEKLLPHWTSTNEKLWREHYRVVGNTMWVRIRDDGMGGMVIKQLYGLLFDTGEYTFADREEDNAAFGYEIEAMNPTVAATLEYRLEGDDLLIILPAGEVESISSHAVQMIEIAPYFLTGTTEQTGYIFVPDGSGSIIGLNNGKTMALSFINRVYGADVLRNATRYSTPITNITLPVYGIKTDDVAVLAIIEKGAEIAELYADISARSDEFNRISSRFLLREIENISLVGNDTVTTPRYADDTYEGDIVLRYKLLFDDDATYTGMAHAYREYLVEREMLVAREQEEQAPFYLEIIGAIKKQKFFLGIPYWSTVQATTIDEAAFLYEYARELGIDNIKMLFTGLYWGGVKNASLSRIQLDGGMGSKKSLLALKNQMAENGDMLFPNVNLGRVYDDHNFRRNTQAARRLDGEYAWVSSFSEAKMYMNWVPYTSYYVSPRYLPEYIDKVLKGFANGWELQGLAIQDLANVLTPDYRRREHRSRIHVTDIYEAALATLGDAYPLMLQNPNDYALFAADYVTGLPTDDNGYQVEDYAIPFVQLVLEGMVHYSGDSWNMQSHRGMQTLLMEAIETKSVPRFTMTYQPETIFHNTQDLELQRYLATQYTTWMPEAAEAYAAYEAFYRQVRDARIVLHETISRDVKRVTYDNGVTVLLNYGAAEAELDGVTLAPQSYLVREGM